MKRYVMGSFALLFAATPAYALKVTNLDKVQHGELRGRGSVVRYVIEPDATENITGAAQGTLSLVTAQKVKRAKGTLQSDGLLSGIIGAGRNQDIPVDPNDSYVIWPDGDLRLQSHRKQSEHR